MSVLSSSASHAHDDSVFRGGRLTRRSGTPYDSICQAATIRSAHCRDGRCLVTLHYQYTVLLVHGIASSTSPSSTYQQHTYYVANKRKKA